MSRRVAITGIGLCTPVGHTPEELSRALREGLHGLVYVPEWDAVEDLKPRVAGVVKDEAPRKYTRKEIRTMGRVARLALAATDRAIESAGLDTTLLESGRCGLTHGSTHGSTSALEDFVKTLFAGSGLAGLSGTSYLKFMSHTTAANLAQHYGIRGYVLPTISACTSGSQAVGAGYQAILAGTQDVMLCGGAEELHFTHAAVFDLVFAASHRFNDDPGKSSRPFDKDRDGLVIGEGAGTVILESWEHATSRGAPVLAELVGYGSNCDGTHVTAPSATGMAGAMQLALDCASLDAGSIDYINAHATATELGDLAEATATHSVFGETTPVSSTKGHMGHTLGACGAIEVACCLASLEGKFLPATRNLENPDPRCPPLDFVRGDAREAKPRIVMSNNFAFGGINTSIILQSPP